MNNNNNNYMITGKLSIEREEVVEILSSKNWEEVSNINKADYIIVGQNPGSKLQKAISAGVKILNEDRLFDEYNIKLGMDDYEKLVSDYGTEEELAYQHDFETVKIMRAYFNEVIEGNHKAFHGELKDFISEVINEEMIIHTISNDCQDMSIITYSLFR